MKKTELARRNKQNRSAGGALRYLEDPRSQLASNRAWPHVRTVQSAQDSWFVVDNERVLNLGSNNYLGLANHPRVKQRAKEAIEIFGVGATASRVRCGTTSLHLELERKLATFKGRDSALVFGAGTLANLGAISALFGKEDTLILDELSHPSMVYGCHLSGARAAFYHHNDMRSLRQALEAAPHSRRMLVATEGVFSSEGDVTPLPDIIQLARTKGAVVLVDDAHGTGVLGHHGRGTANHFGMQGQVDIEVGTMGKALGVRGGFIAGSSELAERLRYSAMAYVHSTSPTPAEMGGCLAALDLLEDNDLLVSRLWENTHYFRQGIASLGFNTGNSQTPIIPIYIKEVRVAREFQQRLFQEQVFTNAYEVRGRARLRLQVSAAHTRDDLDFALVALARAGTSLGIRAGERSVTESNVEGWAA